VTTEPAVSLFKHPIAVHSLQEGLDRATGALAATKPGGRLMLAAVDDDGEVGGRVALTFKKVDEDGDTFAVGAFGEFTVTGERRAGGVISWEWS
jgi:pyridoxine/pyridoxamine 5'-phosphate oxidase